MKSPTLRRRWRNCKAPSRARTLLSSWGSKILSFSSLSGATPTIMPTPSRNSAPGSIGSSTALNELNSGGQGLGQIGGTQLSANITGNGFSGLSPSVAPPVIGDPIIAAGGPTSTVKWISATGGNWESAVSWSDSLVPGAGTTVQILAPVSVTLNSAESAAGLVIGAGATLDIVAGGALTIAGNIENSGAIVLDDPPLIISGTVTVSGGGVITMLGPSAVNVVSGAPGTGATLINLDNTISGGGLIGQGDGNLTFVNHAAGTVDANSNGQPIVINTGHQTTNAGVFEATAGGTLTIDDALLNSGKLEANGGIVDVAGAVTGSGSAFVSGGGMFEIGSTDAQAFAFKGDGTLKLDAGSDFTGKVTLAAGAVIDLAGTAVTSAEISGSTVLINGNPETFTVSGLPSGDTLAFKSDGGAGTDLAVLPHALNVASSPVTGTEGSAIPIDMTETLAGGATLTSFVLSGIPAGATLTNIDHDTLTVSGGSITFDAAQIAGGVLHGLSITPANDTAFSLSVSATATDSNSYEYTVPATESVTVDPTAPTLSPVAVTGVEGHAIALDLGIGVTGAAGDSNSIDAVTLTFTVPTGDSYKFTGTSGLDENFTAGANQSLTLTPAELAGLSISTTTDSNVSLSVSAIDKNPAGDLSAAANGTETVTIDPTTPTVSPTAVSGFEGQAIALDLGISPTGEASNTIDAVTLTFAVPTGESYTFTSTSGLDEVFMAGADQTLTLTPAQLAGLAITTTNAGTVSLTVSAIDKDAEGNLSTAASGNETATVNPLSWAGDTLVEYYYYPNTTTTYYTSPTFVAPAANIDGLSDYGGLFSLSVTSATITASNFIFEADFTATAFNGFEIADLSGNPLISGVTIDPSTNLAGLTVSDISFGSNYVAINLEGLSFNTDTVVKLDLTFDPPLNPSDVKLADSLDGSVLPAINAGTLAIAYGTELALNGIIDNVGTIAVDGGSTAAAIGINDSATLSGSGHIELSQSDQNYIFGDGTITNVDNTISGSGDIGNGTLTIYNGGVIEAQGPYALIIDTGPNPFVNTGILATNGGTLIVDSPVTGNGSAIIAGGTLEFSGLSSNAILFSGDTAGTLSLDHSQEFSGTIFGFSGQDRIDLGDIAFSANTVLNYAANDNNTGGMLTVSDGPSTVGLTLVGDFSASSFAISTDGHGGTLIVASEQPSSSADSAKGVITFTDSANSPTASFSADGPHYIGAFSLGAVDVSSGTGSVGWQFSLGDAPVSLGSGQTLTQSYNVAVSDAANPTANVHQIVSVSIGGPGNDSFMFSPGIGNDTVVNFNPQSDIIELDNFANIHSVQELASSIATDTGGNSVIDLGHNDSITLSGVTASYLQAHLQSLVHLH